MSHIIGTVPLLIFLAFGTHLSRTDLLQHRLPNKTVFRLIAGLIVCEAVLSWSGVGKHDLYDSLLVAAKTVLVYIALYGLSRGQFGLGDVKYSIATGLVIGWYAPSQWFLSIMVSFFFAAIVSVFLLATKRMTKTDRIAFGPYMTAATVIVALFSFH